MILRLCLALFMVLSAGLAAASPFTAVLMASHASCDTADAQTPVIQAAGEAMHDHHAMHAAPAKAKTSKPAFDGLSCCDQASVSEVSVATPGPTAAMTVTPVRHVIPAGSLIERAPTDRLQRPPKA